MSTRPSLDFAQSDLLGQLAALPDDGLDALQFGVIGFDAQCVVQRYNAFESRMAGLARERVLGQHLFTGVAPCMNNFLVAQRFEDAQALAEPLDDTLDYVLTLRMKPTKVKLRLLGAPGQPLAYVLLLRPLPA